MHEPGECVEFRARQIEGRHAGRRNAVLNYGAQLIRRPPAQSPISLQIRSLRSAVRVRAVATRTVHGI
jgi:hypothetical protein